MVSAAGDTCMYGTMLVLANDCACPGSLHDAVHNLVATDLAPLLAPQQQSNSMCLPEEDADWLLTFACIRSSTVCTAYVRTCQGPAPLLGPCTCCCCGASSAMTVLSMQYSTGASSCMYKLHVKFTLDPADAQHVQPWLTAYACSQCTQATQSCKGTTYVDWQPFTTFSLRVSLHRMEKQGKIS